MIIVIWRRWGPIGLLFLVLGFLVWVGLAALLRAGLHISATNGWWNIFALVIGFGGGAIANWLFAVRVVEPKLDQPGALPPVATSTLFFLPLRYWTLVIVGIGVLFLVPNVIDTITT